MEFQRTKNHAIIRQWVEEHHGEPVEFQWDGADGLITLNFGRLLLGDYRVISWEEFFAWFDSSRLAFRYRDEMPEGQEERSYNFVSGKYMSDVDDEAELMEENEMAKEDIGSQALL